MLCRLNDLHNKEVINVRDGCSLGYISDVEIDTVTAKVTCLVIQGRCRFLFFFREEDTIINWADIEVIGEDTILVNTRPYSQNYRNNRGPLNFKNKNLYSQTKNGGVAR